MPQRMAARFRQPVFLQQLIVSVYLKTTERMYYVLKMRKQKKTEQFFRK